MFMVHAKKSYIEIIHWHRGGAGIGGNHPTPDLKIGTPAPYITGKSALGNVGSTDLFHKTTDVM
jgi:hypothetical protein